MQWWSKLTIRERVMLVIGLIIVLSGAYYLLIYQPLVNKLDQNRKQIERVKAQIKGKRSVLRHKKRLMHEYKQLEKRLGYSDSIIYQESFLTSSKTVELIVALNKQAMSYNVSLLEIKSSKLQKGDLYHEFPIKIKVRGKYDQITKYLKSIKQNDYLTRVENFKMTSILRPVDQVTADINLIGYTLADTKGGEGDVSETQVQ